MADTQTHEGKPDRAYLYNDDGTLRTPAELAALAPKQQPKPKAAKVARVAKAKAQPKAAAPKTKPVAKARQLRPNCMQLKKDGTHCTAHAMLLPDGTPADYCTDHRPAHLHLTEAEMAWLHKALDTDERPLVERVVRLMGWGQVRERARKGDAL